MHITLLAYKLAQIPKNIYDQNKSTQNSLFVATASAVVDTSYKIVCNPLKELKANITDPCRCIKSPGFIQLTIISFCICTNNQTINYVIIMNPVKSLKPR